MASASKRESVLSEDYWNSSHRRVTPFDFEDDADGYAFMKGFRQIQKPTSVANELEDDLEIVNWDGNPVHNEPVLVGSAAAPGGVISGPPSARAASISPVSIASISGPCSSFSSIADAVRCSDTQPGLGLTSPRSGTGPVSRLALDSPTSTALARPVQSARALVLSTGDRVPLEHHRSLRDKQTLLDEAARLGDTDAITTVILFLRRTLKRSLFESELQRCSAAQSAFLNYLRHSGEHQQAADLLTMLARSEQAAMLHYAAATRSSSAESQLRALRVCLQAHFSADPDLVFPARLLQQQIDLIERQRPVEASRPDDSGIPLVGTSLLTTLYYCCTHHYNKPVNHLGSPLSIRAAHALTDQQYVWTALRARSALQHWNDVQALFTGKTWFGSQRLVACVSFETVVCVLAELSAPVSVLSVYISRVDGADRRLQLAKKYRCHNIAVDTYVAQKDKRALQEFCSSLPEQTADRAYATAALSASTVKWKN